MTSHTSGAEASPPSKTTSVVVVTGLSGAGKSTAMAALEDLGYHAVENLPPAVIESSLVALEQAGVRNVALGFGTSVDAFLDSAAEVLAHVARSEGRKVTIVFLDASDEVVARRFSETRRPHPLLADAALRRVGAPDAPLGAVVDGVQLERERLAPLRAMATVVLDTSGLRVHDLRRRIFAILRPESATGLRMSTRILSFGFKYGLPGDADLVLDVRFLENPYFVADLRPLTGEDPRVRDFVLAAPDARAFLDHAEQLLAFLVPRYETEGKSYLTIAVGCTGGQHRSVALALALGHRLTPLAPGLRVVHRDAHVQGRAAEVVTIAAVPPSSERAIKRDAP